MRSGSASVPGHNRPKATGRMEKRFRRRAGMECGTGRETRQGAAEKTVYVLYITPCMACLHLCSFARARPGSAMPWAARMEIPASVCIRSTGFSWMLSCPRERCLNLSMDKNPHRTRAEIAEPVGVFTYRNPAKRSQPGFAEATEAVAESAAFIHRRGFRNHRAPSGWSAQATALEGDWLHSAWIYSPDATQMGTLKTAHARATG